MTTTTTTTSTSTTTTTPIPTTPTSIPVTTTTTVRGGAWLHRVNTVLSYQEYHVTLSPELSHHLVSSTSRSDDDDTSRDECSWCTTKWWKSPPFTTVLRYHGTSASSLVKEEEMLSSSSSSTAHPQQQPPPPLQLLRDAVQQWLHNNNHYIDRIRCNVNTNNADSNIIVPQVTIHIHPYISNAVQVRLEADDPSSQQQQRVFSSRHQQHLSSFAFPPPPSHECFFSSSSCCGGGGLDDDDDVNEDDLKETTSTIEESTCALPSQPLVAEESAPPRPPPPSSTSSSATSTTSQQPPTSIVNNNNNNNNSKKKKKKKSDWHYKVVIMDRYCGEAVLRGAPIYCPGIICMDATMQRNDLVAVYMDVGPSNNHPVTTNNTTSATTSTTTTQITRGMALSQYKYRTMVCMGIGIMQVADRNIIFAGRRKRTLAASSSGVAVTMIQTVAQPYTSKSARLSHHPHLLPPMQQILDTHPILQRHFHLQNLPSIAVPIALLSDSTLSYDNDNDNTNITTHDNNINDYCPNEDDDEVRKASSSCNSDHEFTVLDMCCAPGGKTSHLAHLLFEPQQHIGDGDAASMLQAKRTKKNVVLVACDKSRHKVLRAIQGPWKQLHCAQYIHALALDTTRAVVTSSRLEDYYTSNNEINTTASTNPCDTEPSSLITPNHNNSDNVGIDLPSPQSPQPPRQCCPSISQILGSAPKSPKDGLLQIRGFPPESFDRILLDPPCSALGLRPKLKIEYTTVAQLESVCAYQRQFVDVAVSLLKPGGYMTYSTCTIHILENEGMVRYILDRYSNMELIPLPLAPELGHAGLRDLGFLSEEQCHRVRRFGPTNANSNDEDDTIGFFIAKFRKNRSTSLTQKMNNEAGDCCQMHSPST